MKEDENLTREERHIFMTETPIERLVLKLAVPTIISMLVTSIYNMADTYFVSHISTEASAAVGVTYSIMAMIQAIGFTLGMGSGTFVSRLLGQKEYEKAKRTVSTAFFTAIILGLLLCACTLPFLGSFVKFLGAIKSVQPEAKAYARYILIGAPIMTASFVLNNQLRAQGNALFSMIGIGSGTIINIFLDPILIFSMNMGIAGAALATIISQFISFCLLLSFTNLRQGSISVSIKNFKPSLDIYKEILHSGLPSFCRQGLASVSSIILNVAAGPFGASALSALSIVNKYALFIHAGLIGFCQGFQPVSGFNFGAKRYDRVRQAFSFCLKVGVIFLGLLGVLSFIFAPYIMTFFRENDKEVIDIGTLAIRFQSITFPLQAVAMMSQFLSQSIGYGGRASIIAMGRQGLFLIPLYIILSKTLGLLGLQMSQAVSDVLTFFVAIIITVGVLRNLKELETDAKKE